MEPPETEAGHTSLHDFGIAPRCLGLLESTSNGQHDAKWISIAIFEELINILIQSPVSLY